MRYNLLVKYSSFSQIVTKSSTNSLFWFVREAKVETTILPQTIHLVKTAPKPGPTSPVSGQRIKGRLGISLIRPRTY